MSLSGGHTVCYVASNMFARAIGFFLIFACRNPSGLRPLRILHLFANLVAEDFVPVDLGAGDWELSA